MDIVRAIVSWLWPEQPKPGDPIEIPRGLYSHWAVYIGDGNVVHLTGADGFSGYFISGVPSPDTKKVVVKKEPLSKVGGKYHVNKKYDQQYERRRVEEILRLADALVGKGVDYDLFGNNCEHFVTWLCYRVPRSEQVETLDVALLRIAGQGLARLWL